MLHWLAAGSFLFDFIHWLKSGGVGGHVGSGKGVEAEEKYSALKTQFGAIFSRSDEADHVLTVLKDQPKAVLKPEQLYQLCNALSALEEWELAQITATIHHMNELELDRMKGAKDTKETKETKKTKEATETKETKETAEGKALKEFISQRLYPYLFQVANKSGWFKKGQEALLASRMRSLCQGLQLCDRERPTVEAIKLVNEALITALGPAINEAKTIGMKLEQWFKEQTGLLKLNEPNRTEAIEKTIARGGGLARNFAIKVAVCLGVLLLVITVILTANA